MPIKAVLFDMFDTLMLIEKNHEFYSPSLIRMYNYLHKNGIEVPFDKFNEVYIKVRDALYVEADLNWEEPHFNVRVSKTLKNLGYDYDVSSPIVTEATYEFCEEFIKYVRIDQNAKAMLEQLAWKIQIRNRFQFCNS